MLGRYSCGIDLWYRHPDGSVVKLFWRIYLAEKSGVRAGRAGCRHLFWRLWYCPRGARRNACLREAKRQDDYFEYLKLMNEAMSGEYEQAEASPEQGIKEEAEATEGSR